MNNLVYGNQKQDEISTKVEELLRKELGSGSLIPYNTESQTSEETGVKTTLHDVWSALKSGQTTELFSIHFQLRTPRAFDLEVHMNRQGMGCYAGPLVYTAAIEATVISEVVFDEKGQFVGDGVASKLNANKDILKKSDAFAVNRGGISGFELKIPRYLKIIPQASGAQITAATLPRSKSMGFSATFLTKEFLELVQKLEDTLK
jgi:hypothetical protein